MAFKDKDITSSIREKSLAIQTLCWCFFLPNSKEITFSNQNPNLTKQELDICTLGIFSIQWGR